MPLLFPVLLLEPGQGLLLFRGEQGGQPLVEGGLGLAGLRFQAVLAYPQELQGVRAVEVVGEPFFLVPEITAHGQIRRQPGE